MKILSISYFSTVFLERFILLLFDRVAINHVQSPFSKTLNGLIRNDKNVCGKLDNEE